MLRLKNPSSRSNSEVQYLDVFCTVIDIISVCGSIPIEILIHWPRAVMFGPRPRVILTLPLPTDDSEKTQFLRFRRTFRLKAKFICRFPAQGNATLPNVAEVYRDSTILMPPAISGSVIRNVGIVPENNNSHANGRQNFKYPFYSRATVCAGTAVAQWLRCCATNRKVAGSIPAGVTGIFH